jgi:hypothetical protein
MIHWIKFETLASVHSALIGAFFGQLYSILSRVEWLLVCSKSLLLTSKAYSMGAFVRPSNQNITRHYVEHSNGGCRQVLSGFANATVTNHSSFCIMQAEHT